MVGSHSRAAQMPTAEDETSNFRAVHRVWTRIREVGRAVGHHLPRHLNPSRGVQTSGSVSGTTNLLRSAVKAAAALLVCAAIVAFTIPTAKANTDGHQITYTVTAEAELYAQIFFMAKQPPSITAYADNAAGYLYSVRPKINRYKSWTYTTTLNDPDQWATVSAFNHYSEREWPADVPGVLANFHCQIDVDGHMVVSLQGDRAVECTLRQW